MEIRLLPAERKHLLNLLHDKKMDGSYYGNKKAYYERTEKIINKLTTR